MTTRNTLAAFECLFIVVGTCRAELPPSPASQPEWEWAGVWFDLAGNPWTVTIDESPAATMPRVAAPAPRRFFGLACGATEPTARPKGLPFVPPESLVMPPTRRAGDRGGIFAIIGPTNRPAGVFASTAGLDYFIFDTRHKALLVVTIWRTQIYTVAQPPISSGYQHPQWGIYSTSQRRELVRDASILTCPPVETPRPIGELAVALTDLEWSIRRDAICELATCEPDKAVPLLGKAMTDECDINKVLAVRGLAGLKHRAAVPVLADVLVLGPAVLQPDAIRALVALGPEAAGEVIERFVKTINSSARPIIDYSHWNSRSAPAPVYGELVPAGLAELHAAWGDEALSAALKSGDPKVQAFVRRHFVLSKKVDCEKRTAMERRDDMGIANLPVNSAEQQAGRAHLSDSPPACGLPFGAFPGIW